MPAVYLLAGLASLALSFFAGVVGEHAWVSNGLFAIAVVLFWLRLYTQDRT